MSDSLNENTKQISRMADLMEANAAKAKSDNTSKKLSSAAAALGKNTTALLGVTQGFLSLGNIFSTAAKNNSELVKQLGQFSKATIENQRAVVASFNTGFTTFEEGIETQGELINAGMGQMTAQNKSTFLAMKALGFEIKNQIGMTRFNTEALGLSESASTKLAANVVATSIENATSVDALTNAMASMKAALIKTTAALGPEMGEKVQNVVLRMTQNNSELADTASRFVTSLLAGEEGFMKAARLGIGVTGQETEGQLAAKIETAMSRILQLTEGATGFGGQIVLQRLDSMLGITAEEVNLIRRLGPSIDQLRTENLEDAAKARGKMDASRTLELAMFKFRAVTADATANMATYLQPLVGWLPQALAFLATIAAASTMRAFTPLSESGGSISGGMKAFNKLQPKMVGTAAILASLPTIKDIVDVARPDKRSTGDIGGVIGGALGGFAGATFGGPVGLAIGMSIGNGIGKMLGNKFTDPLTKREDKTIELLEEIHGNTKKEGEDTEEIKRIQQEQERRQRSLANPQLHILTSINDILVTNLATLGRIERLNSESNTINEDIKHAQQLQKPPAPKLAGITSF